MLSSAKLLINVGARSSPLSQVQVKEVLAELRQHHPDVDFQCCLTTTVGDRDLKTSLRTLDKTDFFTRDVDRMVLEGICRIGIHSAKDLPDPLPEGLTVVALTKGVDPSDSLVMREGETFETMPAGSRVATSSKRREEMVSELRNDFVYVDIRGTIEMRLEQLDLGDVDAVVIAEAALIRLGLTDRNRITLPGETVEGQGRLAVVARSDDTEMRELFKCIDFV